VTQATWPPPALAAFVSHWQPAGGAERANYQLFLTELCDLLNVPHPNPSVPDESKNNYVFDRAITATNPDGTTTPNFIDLYRRAHFVLETKQGVQRQDTNSGTGVPPVSPADIPPRKPLKTKKGHGIRGSKIWDDAMIRAKSQAENYVRSIPDDNPPFLLVVDVGYQIETYADFSGLGKTYTPFPDNLSHRFKLTDLLDPRGGRGPELFERLQKIWTDPQSLNPAKRAAKVTREIAASLAELSKSLEKSGHHPEAVAHFLMRVLFTLFAEDVHLIPNNAFTNLLKDLQPTPQKFAPMAQAVWQNMDKGGFSPVLREDLLKFNGGLFADTQALPLTGNQLELLYEAAKQDWSEVEPAIFGTLLERALDPTERHKLGAHYTPRAYVERLVLPTVIEPLREEWTAAKTTAIKQANEGELKKAIKTVGEFLKHLCSVTILDPACGSGNFLYVTLEHLKRLEGEVNDFLHQFPNAQLPLEYTGLTVDPHQLRGIEINPRAAAITDLVLWIGYLQWHFRTHGNTMPQEPVLKKFDNIENRDAVLQYEKKELSRDPQGKPITRWDGTTTKSHPVTGELVPDEAARTPIFTYRSPSQSVWPPADYIVGNPPFLGASKIREALGEGYANALRSAFSEVNDSADFVMYWWNIAAVSLRSGLSKRFGFITTKSISQPFNRRVTEPHLKGEPPISVVFAIPNHPWVDSGDGADVRIALTTAESGRREGLLSNVVDETSGENGEILVSLRSRHGYINADLTIGADVTSASALSANALISSEGVKPHGMGFVVTREQATLLGLGRTRGVEKYIRPYMNGRDLTSRSRDTFIIDLDGLSASDVRAQLPEIYQWVLERVKPERDHNNEKSRRENWWLFGRKNTELRSAIRKIRRYIATVKTAKHRVFTFLPNDVVPDSKLIVIALEDSFGLGVLSSRAHTTWSLASGSRLGVGDDPTYVKSISFEAFPFPDCTEKQKSRVGKIAEELDAHRKGRQAKYPDLTLTDMYNILEKLRAADRGEISAAQFSPKDKQIHDRGLISILKQLHDDLDAAVFDAYGWPATLTDDQLLEKLVALNHQRAAEERKGIIKYLRPEFQAGAKDFLRLETIPRLAKATPDFPYFSLDALRADLKKHNIAVETATLPRYLHDLSKERIIFDAGRGWYSTIATPFSLDRAPVADLVTLLEKRFPFLDFAAWSTAQIASYGHHLLARFVAFLYTDKDALEGVSDALRDAGYAVFLDPSPAEAKKNFRIEDKTVVIRPTISEGPLDGKFATIEKIIVDLCVESMHLNILDIHELQRLTLNLIQAGRVSMGTLARYAEHRRKIRLKDIFGEKIN